MKNLIISTTVALSTLLATTAIAQEKAAPLDITSSCNPLTAELQYMIAKDFDFVSFYITPLDKTHLGQFYTFKNREADKDGDNIIVVTETILELNKNDEEKPVAICNVSMGFTNEKTSKSAEESWNKVKDQILKMGPPSETSPDGAPKKPDSSETDESDHL